MTVALASNESEAGPQDRDFRLSVFGPLVDSPSKRLESVGSRSMGERHCLFEANQSKHLPSSADRSGVLRPVMEGQKNSAGGSRLIAQMETSVPTWMSRS